MLMDYNADGVLFSSSTPLLLSFTNNTIFLWVKKGPFLQQSLLAHFWGSLLLDCKTICTIGMGGECRTEERRLKADSMGRA